MVSNISDYIDNVFNILTIYHYMYELRHISIQYLIYKDLYAIPNYLYILNCITKGNIHFSMKKYLYIMLIYIYIIHFFKFKYIYNY